MTPRSSARHPPGFNPSPDWVSPIRRYTDRFCGRRGFFLSTFDPALPERFPTLREFIAFRSSANHKPAKSIAMDMDLSPSMLSRKLNTRCGDRSPEWGSAWACMSRPVHIARRGRSGRTGIRCGCCA